MGDLRNHEIHFLALQSTLVRVQVRMVGIILEML